MGLRAQATYQHRVEPPPLYIYIRDSRPNPATVDVNQTDTGETGSLVDSFPEAQAGPRAGIENSCVRPSGP